MCDGWFDDVMLNGDKTRARVQVGAAIYEVFEPLNTVGEATSPFTIRILLPRP